MVEHERRSDQLRLDELVVDLVGEPARAPLVLVGEPEAVEHRARRGDVHRRVDVDAHVLADEVDHGGARPRFGEVDALAAQLEHGVAVARDARAAVTTSRSVSSIMSW